MPCTSPIDAWPASPDAADRRLVFSPMRSYSGAKAISIPCGKCDSCRQARSRGWATRIVHEAQLHASSYFVTVTYSPENLPADLSVSVREHQLFMKRLRERFGAMRFFVRAEYGERFLRPHMHYILFGLELSDLVPWKRTASGEMLYRSEAFEAVWGLGQCLVGLVTYRSAAYCAGYVNKKAAGRAGVDPYMRFNGETGETWQVAPEFVLMSRRPGIGAEWYARFKRDAFPSDFVVIDGQPRPVPRYYKNKLSVDEARQLVVPRRELVAAHAADSSERRLMTRHESARLRAERFVRDFEEA